MLFLGTEEIVDSVVVGQPWQNDVRVLLFVVLRSGPALDEALTKKIKGRIRVNTTPRHVPERILAVPDIPRTINGKKVELAVLKTILGEPVKSKDALANPEALAHFAGLEELAR